MNNKHRNRKSEIYSFNFNRENIISPKIFNKKKKCTSTNNIGEISNNKNNNNLINYISESEVINNK